MTSVVEGVAGIGGARAAGNADGAARIGVGESVQQEARQGARCGMRVGAQHEVRQGVPVDVRHEVRRERALAVLYQVFSDALDRPGAALVGKLRDGTFSKAMDAAFGAVGEAEVREALKAIGALRERLSSEDDREFRAMLEADFNRLFVGPGRLLAPPYESVYRNPQRGLPARDGKIDAAHAIDGRFAARLHGQYRQAGFKMAEGFRDSADSLRAEVEFLGQVHGARADALVCGDAVRADELGLIAERFAHEHLGRWIGDIARDVHAHARLPFYPALLTFVKCAVTAEDD